MISQSTSSSPEKLDSLKDAKWLFWSEQLKDDLRVFDTQKLTKFLSEKPNHHAFDNIALASNIFTVKNPPET